MASLQGSGTPFRLSRCVSYPSPSFSSPNVVVRPFLRTSLRVAVFSVQRDAHDAASSTASIASRFFGVGLAAFLLAAAPAPAELQTVPADQLTTMAKPLKVQQVNKGRVWLLFVLGASSLFGATVLLENNEAWFPAISRANRAMTGSWTASQTREASEQEEQQKFDKRLEEVREERAEDARLESAVLAGLAEARRRDEAPVATPEGQSGYEESNGTYPTELSSGQGEAVPENQEPEVRGEPLYEIGADQIEASTRDVQRQTLKGVGLDDLQRELQSRKAGAGQNSDE